MLKKQRGNVIFWVLSAVLAIALALILLLSGKYNLDPEKNIDDCTTCMKNIWVAVNDYILDTNQDFNGDMKMLRSATKPGTKNTYLSEEKYCPELQGEKIEYIVYGKHVTEVVEGETKHYSGILVFCPKLGTFAKHLLDKTFYDNMSTSKLQNLMVNDISKIDAYTKSNAKLKNEYMLEYLKYWQNNTHKDFASILTDQTLIDLRVKLTGETLASGDEVIEGMTTE